MNKDNTSDEYLRISENGLKNESLKALSNASMEMMQLKNKNETLEYITNFLSDKYPEITIISTQFNEAKNALQIISAKGSISKLIEKETFYNDFDISASLINFLKKEKLIQITEPSKILNQNTKETAVKNFLLKILADRDFYTIGIVHEEKLLGALWILTKQGNLIINDSFIISFINMASIVIKQQTLLEALHANEETLSKIFNFSNAAIAIQKPDKIYLVNKAWERITGYTSIEAETLLPEKLIHPQEREYIMNITRKRLKNEEVPSNYIFHLLTKSGEEKWLDLSASIIDYNNEKCTLIIASDITKRKNDELELIKLSTGIINSPSSIVITDVEGNIEYVNPFFTQFTGYTFNEVIGKNPRLWKSGNTPIEVYRELWATILSGKVWKGELANRKKSGEIYWESATIAPILDKDGIIISFIGIKADITEQIITLGRLEKSEKKLKESNAKKDKFFSIIAHDLRGPFGALLGLAKILKKNYKSFSDDETEHYLELLNQSTENVFKLLENLLAWSKTQTGRMEFNPTSINTHDLVNEVISLISLSAKNKAIEIKNEIMLNLRLDADKNMLQTIFRNLIANAIKYTHRDGKIKIGAITESFHNKKLAKFWVADNGVGIPEDKVNKLFRIEENYSTKGTEKEKGSGLGLILCKEFIEMHKGNIWVESEAQKGSTFYFTLPLTS